MHARIVAGGREFQFSIDILCRLRLKDGEFVDRDPDTFEALLSFLRTGDCLLRGISEAALIREVFHYQLEELPLCTLSLRVRRWKRSLPSDDTACWCARQSRRA